MRGKESITTKPHLVSNCEEIGRALIDTYDMDHDIEDGPAPKTIAVEFLIREFVEQRSELFEEKERGEQGQKQIVYVGSEDNE